MEQADLPLDLCSFCRKSPIHPQWDPGKMLLYCSHHEVLAIRKPGSGWRSAPNISPTAYALIGTLFTHALHRIAAAESIATAAVDVMNETIEGSGFDSEDSAR